MMPRQARDGWMASEAVEGSEAIDLALRYSMSSTFGP